MPPERCPVSGTGLLWPRLAVIVWLLVIGGIAIKHVTAERGHSVLPIYLQAGERWAKGEELYRPFASPSELDAFRYSPPIAACFQVLGWFSPRIAALLWLTASTGLFLTALQLWNMRGLPRSLSPDERAWLFLLVLPAAGIGLHSGQTNAIVCGLLLGAATCILRHFWTPGSICLAIACLLKVYPLALALLFIILHPRPLVWRMALVVLAGLATPFLLQDSEYVIQQYAHWLNYLAIEDRSLIPLPLAARDFGLLIRLYDLSITPLAYVGIRITAAALIACLALEYRRRGWPECKLLTFLLGLGMSWMILFGSAAESSTYVLIAPSFAWTLLETWPERQLSWAPMALLISGGLVGLGFLGSLLPGDARHWFIGAPPLGALLFAGVLLMVELQRRLHVGCPLTNGIVCFRMPPAPGS